MPLIGWFSTSLPSLTHYINKHNVLVPTDINVLEFIASILAIVSILVHVTASTPTSSYIHVHVYTDNTSAQSWLAKNISTHPLHAFLLQVLAHTQSYFGLILTFGYIPGQINIYADAASRHFKCPNGTSIFNELQTLHQFPVCTPLLTSIVNVATMPWSTISVLALNAHTVADEIISWISVESITYQLHLSTLQLSRTSTS